MQTKLEGHGWQALSAFSLLHLLRMRGKMAVDEQQRRVAQLEGDLPTSSS